MGFNIDFETITLDALEQLLLESNLVPSRMILKEHADSYFELLRGQKIPNVHELYQALKKKKGLSELADQTGIPEEYLTVLAREIKGYIRKPIKLVEFPGLDSDTVTRLAKEGIVNALHLFDRVLTAESRDALASQTGIEKDELLMATKLVDLSRIRWVNHTFSYALYEAGFDTAEKAATADPQDMYEKIKKLNEERKLFPAHIGVNDMKRCIEAAQLVPFDIEY